MQLSILRLPAVITNSGHSRTVIYRKIAEGLWPKPVSLGTRCVGWPCYEIDTMNAAHIAGKSLDELRTLVLGLEQARKHISFSDITQVQLPQTNLDDPFFNTA